MKRFLVAAVALVSVGAMSLPNALPASADEPAAEEVDEIVVTDPPPTGDEPDVVEQPDAGGDDDEADTTDPAREEEQESEEQPSEDETPAPEEQPKQAAEVPQQQIQELALAQIPEEHKVWVCHATAGLGELKNGYNLIHVDVNATLPGGNGGNTDHYAHANSAPKNNAVFGVLYDYIDVDPNNLPEKCGAPEPEFGYDLGCSGYEASRIVNINWTYGESGGTANYFLGASEGPGDQFIANVDTGNGIFQVADTVPDEPACRLTPPDKVEYGEWEDGEYECEDTTVEQTRTVTTTPYIYSDGQFVEDTENATIEMETQTRDLTEEEITECPTPPELEYTFLGPVCIDNFPYIGWTVAGEGFDTNLPLTITLSQGDTVIQTIDDAPFSGNVIWPGASVNPPDWPGWRLNAAGVWVPDPSDAGLREDITVTASVNPTASATVSYPPATSECADPPEVPPTTAPPTTAPPAVHPPGTLPATGSGVSPIVAVASMILLLGGGAVLATRRRPGTTD